MPPRRRAETNKYGKIGEVDNILGKHVVNIFAIMMVIRVQIVENSGIGEVVDEVLDMHEITKRRHEMEITRGNVDNI